MSFLNSWRPLTEAERTRMARADMAALERALARGVGVIENPKYPGIDDPGQFPPALFYWGDPEVVGMPSIGIVGTRAASTYGKAVAQKFAEALAEAGLVIVSGGALGVDGAAHRGALSVGGKTIVVLGTGIDRVYPHKHASLFEQAKQSGCLVSQFAVGKPSREFSFLMRNPIIPALSWALLVVEAPERSGSLNTAHAAIDQGKQVFVVPANIDNVQFRGSHSLIRDGATLVDHPNQILEALGLGAGADRPETEPASPSQRTILAALSTEAISTEKIVEATGMEPSEVLAELTLLELEGRVIRDGIGYARRP